MNFKEYNKIIKELKENNINMLGLSIAYELECQLGFCERKFTEEEKDILLDNIERAYLKSEDLSIEVITRKAIELFDNLESMTTWDLIEESCY